MGCVGVFRHVPKDRATYGFLDALTTLSLDQMEQDPARVEQGIGIATAVVAYVKPTRSSTKATSTISRCCRSGRRTMFRGNCGMMRGVEGVHQSLCLVFRRSSSFANAVRAKSACFSPSSSAALTCRNVPFGTRTRIRSSIGGRPRLGFFAINPPKFSDIAYLLHCTLRYLLVERQDATELVAKYDTRIFRKPNHVDHDY